MKLHVRLKMRYVIVRMGYVNAGPQNRVDINLGLRRATLLSAGVHVVQIPPPVMNIPKYAIKLGALVIA